MAVQSIWQDIPLGSDSSRDPIRGENPLRENPFRENPLRENPFSSQNPFSSPEPPPHIVIPSRKIVPLPNRVPLPETLPKSRPGQPKRKGKGSVHPVEDAERHTRSATAVPFPTNESKPSGLPFYSTDSQAKDAKAAAMEAPSIQGPPSRFKDDERAVLPGMFSQFPFPGVPIEYPGGRPEPEKQCLGYETRRAEVGCMKTQTLNSGGCVAAVATAVIFFPLAFVVCWLPEFHQVVQRPVYGVSRSVSAAHA